MELTEYERSLIVKFADATFNCGQSSIWRGQLGRLGQYYFETFGNRIELHKDGTLVEAATVVRVSSEKQTARAKVSRRNALKGYKIDGFFPPRNTIPAREQGWVIFSDQSRERAW